MLRVLLLNDPEQASPLLSAALQDAEYDVVVEQTFAPGLLQRALTLCPDVIVVEADAPRLDLLDRLEAISQALPRPLVLFTDEVANTRIQAAIKAGVTAYIIAGMQPERIKWIVEVACVRFQHEQTLRGELRNLQDRLSERKLIEKAKGVLMAQKHCTEDDAYRSLRKLAMDRNLRLIDVARQLLDISKLLV